MVSSPGCAQSSFCSFKLTGSGCLKQQLKTFRPKNSDLLPLPYGHRRASTFLAQLQRWKVPASRPPVLESSRGRLPRLTAGSHAPYRHAAQGEASLARPSLLLLSPPSAGAGLGVRTAQYSSHLRDPEHLRPASLAVAFLHWSLRTTWVRREPMSTALAPEAASGHLGPGCLEPKAARPARQGAWPGRGLGAFLQTRALRSPRHPTPPH